MWDPQLLPPPRVLGASGCGDLAWGPQDPTGKGLASSPPSAKHLRDDLRVTCSGLAPPLRCRSVCLGWQSPRSCPPPLPGPGLAQGTQGWHRAPGAGPRSLPGGQARVSCEISRGLPFAPATPASVWPLPHWACPVRCLQKATRQGLRWAVRVVQLGAGNCPLTPPPPSTRHSRLLKLTGPGSGLSRPQEPRDAEIQGSPSLPLPPFQTRKTQEARPMNPILPQM